MQETFVYLMHRNDPVCTVTGKTIYRVNNHHFWHKKSYQNRPKKTPRHSAHFQSGKNPCGSKEIRFQNCATFGGQSRHIEENSSTLGALR